MLAPLAVSIHVPVLLDIGRALTGDGRGAAPTVSVFLWVFAAAMLGAGPASDRWGRRPVLLSALVLYGFGSALAAASPSLPALLAARALQALGASALVIVPRAMVRDAFDETTAPMSRLATLQSIAPAIAPLLGAALGAWLSWRATFAALALGAAALGALGARLPETRAPSVQREAVGDRPRWGRFGLVTLAGAGASAVYFALLPAAARVLSVFGSGAPIVGLALLGVAAGFAGGAALASRLSRRHGRLRAMGGLASALLAGTLLALLLPTAVGVGLGLSIYAVAAGALLPLAVAEGLDAVPAQAGRAASILGAMQLTVGAGASSLVESGLEFGAVALAAAVLTALSAWAGVVLSCGPSLRPAALVK